MATELETARIFEDFATRMRQVVVDYEVDEDSPSEEIWNCMQAMIMMADCEAFRWEANRGRG